MADLESEDSKDSKDSEDSRSTQAFRQTQEFQLDEASGPILYLLSDNDLQKEISLSSLPLTIGRDPKNDLVIDDSSISRFHAEIRDLADRIQILDLGSTNGIKINGALVQSQALMSRDVIHIGDIMFEFLSSREEVEKRSEVRAVRETIVSNTAAMGGAKKRLFKTRRSKKIAAVFFVILVLGLGAQYLKDFSSSIRSQGTQFLATQAEKAVENFKSKIENELGQSIEVVSDEDLRTRFQAELDSISLPLAENMIQGLRGLPAPVIRFFLKNFDLLKDYMKDMSSTLSIENALAEEIRHLIERSDLSEAGVLLRQLSKINPQNGQVIAFQEEIERRRDPIVTPEIVEISEEERELFYSYMKTYQDRTEELLEAQKFDLALQFIDDIRAAIIELSRAGAQYGDLVGSALKEWSSKKEQIERKLKEQERQNTEKSKFVLAGEKKLEEVRDQLNVGKVHEAQRMLQKFLEEFPQHPERENAERLQAEIERAIRMSFDSLKSQVDTYLRVENFKVAWESIYRFMDLVPDYALAEELKDEVSKQTRMRAAQLYNQARVFEFEADDLIAAEQYYKRVIETADPRGDLVKKAERRYAEVRRKNIQ